MPLCKSKSRDIAIDKVTASISLLLPSNAWRILPPKCIHYHEYDLVERCLRQCLISFQSFILGQTREERFVREEAAGEDQYCDWYEDVGGKEAEG